MADHSNRVERDRSRLWRRPADEGRWPPEAIEYRAEDYIVDEDAWVIVTRDGWAKRQKSFTDVASIRVREEDRVGWVYRSRARQTLTIFTDRGMAYTLRVNDIPMTTGHGDPIQKQFAFEDNEHIVCVLCHDPRLSAGTLAMFPKRPPRWFRGPWRGSTAPMARPQASALPLPLRDCLDGRGKVLRLALAPLAAVSTRKGRSLVRLDAMISDDLVVGVEATDGTENVCLATRSARVLIFPVTEANVVGSAAKGSTRSSSTPTTASSGSPWRTRCARG